MAKTILVPIDFTVRSLNTLKHALNNNQGQEIQVLLLHARRSPDSITDLLFYSPRNEIALLTTPNFEQALYVLKNKFEKELLDVRIELLHNNNAALLDHVLQANKVSEIYIPKNYRMKTGGRSFDPLPLLKKAGLPVREMAWDTGHLIDGVDEVDALFN